MVMILTPVPRRRKRITNGCVHDVMRVRCRESQRRASGGDDTTDVSGTKLVPVSLSVTSRGADRAVHVAKRLELYEIMIVKLIILLFILLCALILQQSP